MSALLHEELVEAFDFLDDLRASGVTNMFGAAPYLVDDLGWSRREAGEALSLWMKTFDPAVPVTDRALKATGAS